MAHPSVYAGEGIYMSGASMYGFFVWGSGAFIYIHIYTQLTAVWIEKPLRLSIDKTC